MPITHRRRTNLVHDTFFRRIRRSLVDAVHAADDKVSRAMRADVRLLFEAASPMSLAVFGPVLDRLRRDERLDLWFTTSDHAWNTDRIFRTASIWDHVITPARARWMKFDAYVNTDFWNTTWLQRPVRRIHLFHGVAGKYDLDAPLSLAPVVATFDRLLFPNRDRLDRYRAAGLVDADSPTAQLVGFPKVDCLVDGSLDRSAIQVALNIDGSRPTVLYAPTWSPYSSLNTLGEQVIAALARLGVNVIVKLHDRSCDGTIRGSGGIDWRARLRALGNDWPVHLAEHVDTSPYLFAADLLVTDHSSVGFEFMLLDRPIVVIDRPELIKAARINRDKVQLLHSSADVVTNVDELAAAVVRGLTSPSTRSAERRAVARDTFYGAGTATARATECIYDVLGLPVPQIERAPHPLSAPMLAASQPLSHCQPRTSTHA